MFLNHYSNEERLSWCDTHLFMWHNRKKQVTITIIFLFCVHWPRCDDWGSRGTCLRMVYGLRAARGREGGRIQIWGSVSVFLSNMPNLPHERPRSCWFLQAGCQRGYKEGAALSRAVILWIPADPLRDTCRISDTVYFPSEPELRYIITTMH